ncbi:hypothetical protein JZ751_024348 [Albula glossodonta]|uniref:Uncharacterized protein n=1 Tax=Albula glossodonta TaxID=121402 RepID=A0A8T2NN08_9TELE|nr:hypothetical protein JZ751_024348 [Albula glossodonta]
MWDNDLSKISQRNKYAGSNIISLCGPATDMGVKVLHCFPWQRRCKERGKRHRPLQAVPPGDTPAYLAPTVAWCSAGEVGIRDRATRQVYVSHKACVALRHQMDCSVIDMTY